MASTSSPTFKIGLIFVVFATVLNFIGFVSPYWLVSEERANNPFQRIGLWEACLKDYVDPKDYVSKLYNGCWWIFWPEFAEIRYWLNPAWFTVVQVLAALNFVILMVGMVIVTGIMCGASRGMLVPGIITVSISFLFSGIEAILFGLGSIDRTWMPKADFNVLSWGYWLHVLGGFFAFISVVALFCNWYNSDDRLDEKDSYDEQGYND